MSSLNVSNIQRFSTGDGPGIRTTLFLKGCNLHCPWCHNPENIAPEPQKLVFGRSGVAAFYGFQMTPDEAAADLLEDLEFYKASGGGVTFSGGEPLLQYDALAELAIVLKNNGVSTLLDTAGCVPWSYFEPLIPLIDDCYFDVKTGKADLYGEVIGGDFELIEANLKKLVLTEVRVTARIPLIPGFNDQEEELRKIGETLARAGVRRADLLPFHRLGSAKYDAMGICYKYKDTLPPGKEAVRRAAEILGEYAGVGIE